MTIGGICGQLAADICVRNAGLYAATIAATAVAMYLYDDELSIRNNIRRIIPQTTPVCEHCGNEMVQVGYQRGMWRTVKCPDRCNE